MNDDRTHGAEPARMPVDFRERWLRTALVPRWLGVHPMLPGLRKRGCRRDHTLVILLAGAYELLTGQERLTVAPGQACLIPAGIAFADRDLDGRAELLVANFMTHAAQGCDPLLGLGLPVLVPLGEADALGSLAAELRTWDERRCRCACGDAEILASRRIIDDLLARYLLSGFRLGRFRRATSRQLPDWLQQAVNELYRNFSQREISVASLARTVGMSPGHLVHGFTRHLGRPPMAWLQDLRVRQACQILGSEPAEPVAEVARRCGFGDGEGFSRSFRRAVGVSPRRWRAQSLPGLAQSATDGGRPASVE